MLKEEVQKALEVLKKGGIILYPTDTVWGIGCDATNASAVDRIYELKKRNDKKSMIVLVDKLDNVSKYVKKVPEVAWDLLEVADKPLTLILPEARGVAENLVPEEKTIGIRVADHDFCKQLIYKLGRPLVSTSANISGEPSPKTFSEISNVIKDGVDMVVGTSFEGKPTRKPSSIIQLGEGGQVQIIRE